MGPGGAGYAVSAPAAVAAGVTAVARGCEAVSDAARGRAPGEQVALWGTFFNELGMC